MSAAKQTVLEITVGNVTGLNDVRGDFTVSYTPRPSSPRYDWELVKVEHLYAWDSSDMESRPEPSQAILDDVTIAIKRQWREERWLQDMLFDEEGRACPLLG